MNAPLIPVSPVAPAAPYMGGKRHLAQRIIARLADIPHHTYVEPFVGMGGVFLRRPFRAPSEVINDISGDVVTLFRMLQRHYQALMDMLRWQLTSRAEFERLLAASPDTLTDLERAARFLYLQRTAYGGKITGRNFGVSPATPGRFDVTTLAAQLAEIHERIAGVVIERLPWPELLERYDTPATLFYLDPPYYGSETDYGPGVFSRADFARMAEHLARLQGAFVLSLNDRPEVREIFAAFEIEAVDTTYTIGAASGGTQAVGEVIIISPGARRDLFSR